MTARQNQPANNCGIGTSSANTKMEEEVGTIELGASKHHAEWMSIICEGLVKKELMEKIDIDQNKGRDHLIKIKYSTQYIWRKEGKYISIFTSPIQISKKTPLPDIKLVTHLSAYENFMEFHRELTTLFGPELTHYIFSSWNIQRVDIWIDVKKAFKEVYKTLYRPQVSKISIFESDTLTVHFGKRPLEVVVYEKELKDGTMGVRYEIRFYKKKCPINHLTEYGQLSNLRILNYLKIISLNESTFLDKAESRRKLVQAKSFIDDYHFLGLNYAKRKANICGNFTRDLGDIFDLSTSEMNLNLLWLNFLKTKFLKDYSLPSLPSKKHYSKNISQMREATYESLSN